MTRQMHLNLFIQSRGHHEASWRHPHASPLPLTDIRYYQDVAKRGEAGLFDSIFLADQLALDGDVGRAGRSWLEPITALAALATSTRHIGLIATASTTYNEPYNLARRFASIDLISKGRVGWNIVTTAGKDAAQNFGLDDVPEHQHRYERATEFVDVCLKLWDSWEDDFLIGDKAKGLFADAAKVHAIDHAGRFFRVRGPLNVPPTPQGHPLLVQAGSSEDGREFAARFAEAVFTAQQTLADITGQRPSFFRAPAGLRSPLLAPVLHRLDLQLVSWTRRGYDTLLREPDRVLERLAYGLAAGDILLLHDGHAARTSAGRAVVLEVLPRLLQRVDAAGLQPVTLARAVGTEAAAG